MRRKMGTPVKMTTLKHEQYDIPNYLIHYNRAEPFLSLSATTAESRHQILHQLNENNAWGLARFKDPEYLPRRESIEQKMRADFIKKGGRPTLQNPIYSFLGRNLDFERDHRNIAYKIDLHSIPIETVSFTYGDSMFCFNEDYRHKKGQGYLSELCSQIYLHSELHQIFSNDDFKKESRLHIEAQLWITPPDGMFHPI